MSSSPPSPRVRQHRRSHHLQRKPGLSACIALGYLVVTTWIAYNCTFSVVLTSGGSNSLFVGLLLVVLCNMASATSLAEAASIVTEGNQEVWSYLLAPNAYKRLASYMTGWTTALGYTLLGLSGSPILSQLILAMVTLTFPSFVVQRIYVSAVPAAVAIFCALFGIFGAKLLAWANLGNFALNVFGLIAVSVTLLVCSRGDFDDPIVFTQITNESG